MKRWLWMCISIGLAAVAAILFVFGLTWYAALGVTFLVLCPIVVFLVMREERTAYKLRDRLLNEIDRSRRHHG